jgi:hypothetical protein
MATCFACKSLLETIEYQARSADEATRVTTTCPSCPIDASRISVDYETMDHPRGFERPISIARRLSSNVELSSVRKVSRLRVEVTSPVPSTGPESRHVTSPMSVRRSTSVGCMDEIRNRVYYQVTGMLPGYCESIISTVTIGFGATLETVQVYGAPESSGSGTKICEGKFRVVTTDNVSITYLYTSSVTNKDTIVVQYDGTLDLSSAAVTLSDLYSTICAPKSLSTYMGRRLMRELGNLSPRAWDVSAPPKQGYKYTSKPDGERMWLVLYGLFWYACEAQREKNILKWKYNGNTTTPVPKSVVCDTEYVAEYGFIFIDSLTDLSGNQVPVIRNLEYALNIANSIGEISANVQLIVREYFDNNDDAQAYSSAVSYPTDGTLGIRDGSTETIKIKAVKGADLLLGPEGELLTSDGDTVAVLNNYDRSHVGKIVEVRFTANANDNFISAHDVFPRTNKVAPNSTEAVENILRSCVQFNSTVDAERTMIVKWCNTLCKEIINRALSSDDTRHIVLDVGTGGGQSLDRFSPSQSVSFIYVEPDRRKALSTARRSKAKMIQDPAELGPMIRSLKTRRLGQVVVNCSLSDMLGNKVLLDALMPEVKCITCTFSAQFVVEDLRALRDTYNSKVFGCMYTYDGAVDDVLVDSCGASMKVTDDGVADIKWGSEKYTEPATYQADYYGLGSIVLGSDILQLPTGADSYGPSQVCKHIRVITS